jgi:ferredoxin
MATIKVRVIPERCQGHARCNAIAPAIFVLDDQGYIGFEQKEIRPDQKNLAAEGVSACPEMALELVEE